MHPILPAVSAALALLCVGAGVAGADPLPVADVTQSADTDDGWHLSVALTRMTINSVPNMAATAFTRDQPRIQRHQRAQRHRPIRR